MTPLQAATMALYIAAAGAALLLSRRDPRHRPVAWYLCVVVAVDALRWGRSLLLPPATGPREGWELVARHAEAGLYLASILALPALAWVVFLPVATTRRHATHDEVTDASLARRTDGTRDSAAVRIAPLRGILGLGKKIARGTTEGVCQLAQVAQRWIPFVSLKVTDRRRLQPGSVRNVALRHPARLSRLPQPLAEIVSRVLHVIVISYQTLASSRRWPIAGLWLGLWSYLIADYPALSGAGLMRVYELVEVGAVLFSGLCFARWLSGPQLLREGLSPAVACTLALTSGPAATVAAPYLTRGTTLEAWPGIVAANGVAVGIALVLQIGALTRRRRLCSG